MAESVKQFFVGFLHPRTWIAAIIALVVSAVVGLAIGGWLIDTLTGLSLSPAIIGELKGIALGVFFVILNVYTALSLGSIIPLVMVIVSGFIAGLVFALVSKKERVAAKSIIGGLNIAVIYLVIVVISFVVWVFGLSGGAVGVYNAAVAILQAAYLDVLVTFLIIWWVSAFVSMIVLSAKHG